MAKPPLPPMDGRKKGIQRFPEFQRTAKTTKDRHYSQPLRASYLVLW